MQRILVLPGDGIGPEVTREARRVLEAAAHGAGIPLHFEHPALFALSLPVAIFAIGMLGLILAATLMYYRAALFLGASLEYPVWLVTGLLIPLSVLPGWVAPISWLLAPTWGVRDLRESATGGSPLDAIAMSLALSACYLAIAVVCLRAFERLARERAQKTTRTDPGIPFAPRTSPSRTADRRPLSGSVQARPP